MRILHMFNWKLKDIETELGKIHEQGFDAVQINPIQPLKNEFSTEWWMSYQPCNFEIGNHFGSKKDLIDLCQTAKYYNIKIFADVICNHVAGADDGSLIPNQMVDERLKRPEFLKEARNISDWDNREEVIHYCLGLPGLNIYNHDLQDIIIDFLNELIDCGVDGFRFDAAKNIALPNEDCDFWPRVTYCLKKYGLFLYGEVIFEKQDRINEYSKYINVATNSIGTDKDKMVKYIENHDTYLDFGYTRGLSSTEVTHQYINLINEYPNTLYYARPFDDEWKSEDIKNAHYQKQKVLRKIS